MATTARDFQDGHLSPNTTSQPGSSHPTTPIGLAPHRSFTNPTYPSEPFAGLNHSSTSRTRRTSTASSGATLRHRRRADTIRAYHRPERPGWQPGAEPGIDTAGETDDELYHQIHQHCDITVVDFSEEKMEQHHLTNSTLEDFLQQTRQDWVSCRWICVNGMSWDVIKLLGNYKHLHRLAVEDLINTKNRTKADWYSDHAYMVMMLAKLVHLRPGYNESESDVDSDSENDTESDADEEYYGATAGVEHSKTHKPRGFFSRLWHGNSTRLRKAVPDPSMAEKAGAIDGELGLGKPNIAGPERAPRSSTGSDADGDSANSFRTLQRFKAGANIARIDFMEAKSALAHKNLAVSVEQVSIFLCADSTVISFFENSAPDILKPILARLKSAETILRRSGDASMLTQSLIDALIDLAIPVAAAYDDAIGTLEFEVLTNPDMSQPRKLYILSSELTLLRNTIQPISSLVNALRDHHNDPAGAIPPSTPALNSSNQIGHHAPARQISRKPVTLSTVEISPLTHMYLGDVEDHIVVLTSSLEQMAGNASDLTSLIFNTMGAYQNESMKQLTLVTIFFLPLTFLTGYFGMNFESMWSVQDNSDAFFWYIAVPVQVCVSLYLLRGTIARALQRGKMRIWIRGRERKIKKSEDRRKVDEGRRRSLAASAYGGGSREERRVVGGVGREQVGKRA